ncbi:MAG: hypothetical protein IT162_10255 [Bryobacterales bacterium]|nr:hypothetical protein [Bryobacterales bacterium]
MSPPLETLRAELRRHGLPRPYVERVCGEWEEHLAGSAADLEAEGLPPERARAVAAQRLGCPVALAGGLRDQQVAHSLCLRHPAAMTLVISAGVFLLLGALQLLAIAALWDTLPREWLAAAQQGGRPLLLAASAALTFRVFASRFGQRRWYCAALAVLAVLSYTAVIGVRQTPGEGAVAVLRLIP